MSVTT